jgi:hypothetical protein
VLTNSLWNSNLRLQDCTLWALWEVGAHKWPKKSVPHTNPSIWHELLLHKFSDFTKTKVPFFIQGSTYILSWLTSENESKMCCPDLNIWIAEWSIHPELNQEIKIGQKSCLITGAKVLTAANTTWALSKILPMKRTIRVSLKKITEYFRRKSCFSHYMT